MTTLRNKSKNITFSVLGLFSTLFVTRLIINVTYSSNVISVSDTWDYIISSIIAMAITALMIIPIYYLTKESKNLTFTENLIKQFNRAAIIFIVIFIIYFLYTTIYTLSLFSTFLNDMLQPQINPFFLCLCLILVSLYAANKGIETVVRASSVIFGILIISIVVLAISLIPQIDTLNFKPFFENGFVPTLNGLWLMLARNFSIPVLVVLLPFCKGHIKKGLTIWTLAVYVVFIILIVVITGVLGDYIIALKHPVLSSTTLGELGILKRLDAIYLGFWTSGIFVKISLYLVIIKVITKSYFGTFFSKITLYTSAAIAFAIGLSAGANITISSIVFNTWSMFTATMVTGTVIPIIILIKTKRRKI